MPRKTFKRLLPMAQPLLRDRNLRALFGELLHQPNLWHLNRASVSAAVSVGLFVAFVPVPGQMLLAAAAAILLGCNLPISVAFVWITNPVTIAPMFYAAYKLGAGLLGDEPRPVEFEISFHWLLTTLVEIWQPLLTGCLVLGLAAALAGNLVVRLIWRIHVIASWRERRRRRMLGTVTLREGRLERTPPAPRRPGAE